MKTTLWAPHGVHNYGIDTYRWPGQPQLKCRLDYFIYLANNARQQRHWGETEFVPEKCGGLHSLPQYMKGLCACTLCHKAVLLWCLCLPTGASNLFARGNFPYTSQNRQRMDSTRHRKWSFPTLTCLAFPAARSFWAVIPSLSNLPFFVTFSPNSNTETSQHQLCFPNGVSDQLTALKQEARGNALCRSEHKGESSVPGITRFTGFATTIKVNQY